MQKIVLCILSLVSFTARLPAECPSKTNDYVASSGYKFTVQKPCAVWLISDALSIPRDGLQGLILVGEEGAMLVIGSVVQPKAKLDMSAPMLLKLMRLSNDLDFVKIGIDNDGDLFVRAELYVKKTDADDFTLAMKNVISATAKAYAATQ